MHIHTYIHTYIHTHTYIYIYIYTHIYCIRPRSFIGFGQGTKLLEAAIISCTLINDYYPSMQRVRLGPLPSVVAVAHTNLVYSLHGSFGAALLTAQEQAT